MPSGDFEVVRDGVVVSEELQRRSPEGRWYTKEQAAELLSSAGLVEVALTSGFSTGPVRADDQLFCALGVRPDD